MRETRVWLGPLAGRTIRGSLLHQHVHVKGDVTMIYNNILETIGNTPVVRLNHMGPDHVDLYVKVESHGVCQRQAGICDHQ